MRTFTTLEDLTIIPEIDFVYRRKVKISERPMIKTSKDAYDILLRIWDPGKIELQEQFKVILLNAHGRVLGVSDISSGGISGTVVDLRLIFALALKAAAVSIILAHNHPSGNLRPSKADEELTQKMVSGGRILDIKVNDHLIVTPEGYFSFGDMGLI